MHMIAWIDSKCVNRYAGGVGERQTAVPEVAEI